ncbi:Cationic amino acid transporter 5, partial [Cucurbita argyrosperma subsp. sororia]
MDQPNGDVGGGEGIKRKSCGCSKQDFLPEESFKSWRNYTKALKVTPARLLDRLTARSGEHIELIEMKARNQHEMKKSLTWWDLMWFGIGAGIFVLTGLETKKHASPAVVLSYVVSSVSAMLSVFCYTEFAVEIPAADSYNQLDPIAIIVIIVICTLIVASTKGSSRFNYIASIFHVAIILFIVIASLTKANPKNFTPFAPYGPRGIFVVFAVLFFAYVGFDVVSTIVEETKNLAKDIPIGLVGWCTTLAYCILAITLCLMQPYQQIDQDALFLVAFEAVGWGWAKYIVAAGAIKAGAIKGMNTVLLVNAVGQTLYLTHIARTHMISPCNCRVLGLKRRLDRLGGVHFHMVSLNSGSMARCPTGQKASRVGRAACPVAAFTVDRHQPFPFGSIDKVSFERFGIWTRILLIYYILIRVHASYDSVMESWTPSGEVNSSL